MMIIDILKEIGFPFAYDHFAEGESPDPPFLAYYYQESDNFGADNIVWNKAAIIYLELYTDKKDIETEKNIEKALLQHGIFWNKTEVWIDSEKLYEVQYLFEMEES